MKHLKDISVFFIIGRPRTGTSLLRTLFDAHPKVNIPLECQFIIDLYPKYGAIKKWTERQISSFLKELEKELFFDYWTINMDNLQKDLLSQKEELDYATVCKMVIFHYQSFFNDKQVVLLGDKNPGYTIYTEKLLKIFPEAKFIFINRDYRDNFISLKKVDFELPFISMVTYKWKYFYKAFLKARQKQPDRYYYIRYEDLVDQPDVHFSMLCNFLGIPANNKVFDFYKKAGKIKNIYPEEQINKYHSSLLKPISRNKIGLWKKELSQRKVQIADFVAGKYAAKGGYEKAYRKSGPRVKIIAAPGVLAAKTLYLLTNIINLFPYKLRKLILSEGPLFLGGIYLKLFRRKKYGRKNAFQKGEKKT